MAVANARVNELVALQAEMLLKAAEVRSSRKYQNLAKCRVSRIGSAPMRSAKPTRREVARANGRHGVAHEGKPSSDFRSRLGLTQ